MFVCLFSLCLCDSSSFADCVADSHLSIFLATCVFSYLLSVSLFKWLVISFSSALSALSLSGFDSLANSLANVVHFFFSFFCVSSILFIVLPVFTLLFLLPFFKMIGELRQIHRGETKMAPLFNYFSPLIVLFPPLGIYGTWRHLQTVRRTIVTCTLYYLKFSTWWDACDTRKTMSVFIDTALGL